MNKLCDGKVTSMWAIQLMVIYPPTICTDTPYKSSAIKYKLEKCNSYADYKAICFRNTTLTDCNDRDKYDIYQVDILPDESFIRFAEQLERDENCTGFCNVCPHYLYSNCFKGENAPNCQTFVAKLIKCKLGI